LALASSNLQSTSGALKDAREKFDTTADCEPAVERLFWGAREACKDVALHAERQGRGGVLPTSMKRLVDGSETNKGSTMSLLKPRQTNHNSDTSPLTEQELYAGADAMEIVRDAHGYFAKRMEWYSSKEIMQDLERVHYIGVDAMGLLVMGHLTGAGAAVRRKVDAPSAAASSNNNKSPGRRSSSTRGTAAERADETAAKTRDRLQEALQNRDLMKSIGEYEEYLPLSTRVVRELRAIFECLGGMPSDGTGLLLSSASVPSYIPPPEPSLPPGGKVLRTEKVGSGHYTQLTMQSLKSGYPQLDSYGEARKSVAWASVDGYCRQLRSARKKLLPPEGTVGSVIAQAQIVDSAARDAVRCIEHTMVVVSGEKSVYRCVVSPTSSGQHHDEAGPHYQRALAASYAFVVSSAVDRLLDLIEYTFLREAGCFGDGTSSPGNSDDIRSAGSAAAAGLRIVDGVRMLGPSLSKLCDLPSIRNGESSIASALCVSLHRITVKNCSKTLENLARSIQLDPLEGAKHVPTDARVAKVSSDVVHAIRVISPFVSAYKSVSKRRALPWDQSIGDDAGEIEIFVRFLIKQLISSLQGKAQTYKNEENTDAQAKSHLFMINNTYYLLDSLGSEGNERIDDESDENYRIKAPWFKSKMSKIFDNEKARYLDSWEVLNKHLTKVDERELNYKDNKDILSLESGRLIKSRFSGFIEDFERVYLVHRTFAVIDHNLRETLQNDIRHIFLSNYKAFFDRYANIKFSKKNMDTYLKYTPQKLDSLIGQLFAMQ
jgi:exocyst complex protein 7